MKIGCGWTKTTDDGRTYISVSLDEIFGEWLPFLKNCFITLWHISKDDRNNENSPHWQINLTVKKDEKDKAKGASEVPFD